MVNRYRQPFWCGNSELNGFYHQVLRQQFCLHLPPIFACCSAEGSKKYCPPTQSRQMLEIVCLK